jgi:hypothetical protein
MRRWIIWWLLAIGLAVAWPTQAATGRVIKVLPQFLDLKGRNSISPSLYERDLYQSSLREHTNQCSGMRFNVQWKTKSQAVGPMTLAALDLVGEEYKNFGRVTAWRVTLWEGSRLLGEQKSFLWQAPRLPQP